MPLTRELTPQILTQLGRSLECEWRAAVPFHDDFEQGLSYLAEGQPWLLESERLRNRALFLDVSDAIHRVLVEAQDMVLRRHAECPEWLLNLVWKMHVGAVSVITLNYDTLLEMAAGEICMRGSETHVSRYLRPFAFPAHEGELRLPRLRTFQLFKLHGSLHWTYSGTEEYFGQSIEDSELPRWSIAAGDKLPFVLEDGRIPLIVPPTLHKTKYFDNEKVRSLWRRAALAPILFT